MFSSTGSKCSWPWKEKKCCGWEVEEEIYFLFPQLLGLEMTAANKRSLWLLGCCAAWLPGHAKAVEHPAVCFNILGMCGFKFNSDLELPGFMMIGLGMQVSLRSLLCATGWFVLTTVTKSQCAFLLGIQKSSYVLVMSPECLLVAFFFLILK